MQTYLVGGFVRDQLLGRPAHERDWVVVGATPEMLLQQGFQPVGKSFPVFLHPKTHEEYALARTERKTGTGHTAFSCDANPHVTLDDDLARRDLTINAIALTPDQQIIDPYHGQADLKARVLRHVSSAFVEDPLRVLRVARFAAQLAPWNFTIAPETLALMREISLSGELQTLSHERVWQETEKALHSPAPERFLTTLAECDALLLFFPPLLASLAVLTAVTELTTDACTRYAALLFANEPKLPTPKRYDELAELVHEHQEGLRNPAALSIDARLTLLQHTDALRRTERFQQALIACQAIQQVHCPQTPFPLAYWQEAISALKAINIQPLLQRGLKGHQLREGIEALQRQVLASPLPLRERSPRTRGG